MISQRQLTTKFGLMISLLLATIAHVAFCGAKPPPPIPDLTKPNMWRPSSPKEHDYYNIGPTGMMGIFKGPNKSSMVFVDRVEPGTPAEGKILRGDLLLGVNGTPFKKGDNLIIAIGNAIIEAERNENKGKITFTVWRDKNWLKRTVEKDITTVSVDDILKEVNEEGDALSGWKTTDKAVAYQDKQAMDKAYKDFPLDATTMEVTLTLEVLGTYSDTAPFDCPKTDKIIEKAYPHIIAALKGKSRKGRGGLAGWRSGTIGLALLATGKPEHQKLVTQELHKNERLMNGEPVGKDGWRWGMGAWYGGYYTTFLAEYYLRTGDKAVLPGLRQWALGIARIQAYGGTWGHSGHERAKNFGNLHGPATGYGAMNQAAGPCFYGLALAQKCGLNEPEVDEAVRRSVKFYATYVDKGCVPYGYHAPWPYEDSNGKNGPPALAMKIVGEEYMAKYYSFCGAVSSTWGYRGGHADGTFGNYWPQLASSTLGPKAVAAWMKKAHPWYTMLRRHNGSWVCVNFGGAGGFGGQFHQTSMYMLHHQIPKATLYMTGREPNPKFHATDRDLMHLQDRIDDTWHEFTTDQILDRLDTLSPQLRVDIKRGFPGELLKRYKAGETDMVPKLVKLLDHENHRAREAAFKVVALLGKDQAQKILPRAIEALNDPAELVRMAAVTTIRTANSEIVESEGKRRKGLENIDLDKVINPLFAAALRKFKNDTHDTYNTHSLLQKLMINSNNAFAQAPFGQGYETEKVALVLEEFLSQDPRQSIMDGPKKFWDNDTTVRMAGPIAFVAENYPLNGIMFGGSATSGGHGLLLRHKFLEAIECSAMECNKISRVRRAWRPRLSPTNLGWFNPPSVMKYKGVGKNALPWMYRILVDWPNAKQQYAVSREKKDTMRLDDAIEMIENHPQPNGWSSLRDTAVKAFLAEVDGQGNKDAQVAYCRAALLPERKTYFRQMAAMDRLAKLLGEDATSDLGPYLNHEHWRFRDHSRALALKLKGTKVSGTLVTMATSDDELIAAGALAILGARGDKDGVKAGMKVIANHKSGLVRGAAAQAIYGGSNGDAVDKVLANIKNANDMLELEGYEAALLLRRSEAGKANATAAAIRKAVPGSPIPVRRSLYYVLGQLGGSTNLNFLASRIGTEGDTEFADVVEAISWSPDIPATNLLVKILKGHQGTRRALTASDLSVKRVINGAETLGKVPDKANLDFATEHLKVVRNLQLIDYLGSIHNPRCVTLLYKYMKLGPEKVTAQAAQSIIRSVAGISKERPIAERRAVAEILAGVVEYVNVIYNRKDVEEIKTDQAAKFVLWKTIGDKAGEALKRIYDPKEESIGTDTGIDEDDLDL